MSTAVKYAEEDEGSEKSRILAGKYLTFELGKEEYGIGILVVREIIGLMEITAVPHAPGFIKGVINLRGRVIPVLDLRLKFDMESKEYNERTCIIVTEVSKDEGTVPVGLLVDSVSEVVNVAGREIDPPPPTLGPNTNYILGMAKEKGEVKILLDVDRVVGEQTLQHFADL